MLHYCPVFTGTKLTYPILVEMGKSRKKQTQGRLKRCLKGGGGGFSHSGGGGWICLSVTGVKVYGTETGPYPLCNI